MPLLKWLRSLDPSSLDIVTTNYDLVIESALDKVKDLRIDTGRRANVQVRLDLSRWDKDASVDGGLLTKLHGSVDWQNAGVDGSGQQIIRWGHLERYGPHNIRGIIYPGYKGTPKDEPFKSFHDYFERVLNRATHALFIGFAFRDTFINDVIRQSTPSTKIAVIDPAEQLASQPFLTGAKHLKMGFAAVPPVTMPKTPMWLDELQQWAS